MSMLKNLKGKKQTKAQTKKNTTKPVVDDEQDEQEKDCGLVDINELKTETKVKKEVKKATGNFKLQQKQIDLKTVTQKKPEQKPKITSWVANSVDEVVKKDFKKIDHEFTSLTDQKLNQELLIKQKQEQEKQKKNPITFSNNLNLQKIQKTAAELKMESLDGPAPVNKSAAISSINTPISTTGPAVNFTNSNFKGEFKPIEKTLQELKMQEAQRKRQEQLAAKPAASSWFGANKTNTQPEQKAAFKVSPWVSMATQNQQTSSVGQSVKFAPLKANQGIVQSNGYKFAPINLSSQQQKLNAGRNEPELIFVSKKQQEERRRKREERQKEEKAKLQKGNAGNVQKI